MKTNIEQLSNYYRILLTLSQEEYSELNKLAEHYYTDVGVLIRRIIGEFVGMEIEELKRGVWDGE